MAISLDPAAVRLVDALPDAEATAVAVARGTVEQVGAPLSPRALVAQDFDGSPGQVALSTDGDRLVVAVGGGDGDADPAALRAAAVAAVRAAGKVSSLALDLSAMVPTMDADAAAQLVEGALLATYVYDAHKSEAADPTTLTEVTILAPGVDAGVVERAAAVAGGVALARDLVNEPGGSLTPTVLAERALELAGAGLDVEVWDAERIRAERCGGLMAVNQGSTEPPRLIRFAWEPDGAERTVVVVGKGITFDSGGLSLKTGEGMMTMKCDMGGAAAVVGAASALATLAPATRVIGIICATDNMPSGAAQRPGDVFTARNGTTVEVLNTDAEGRLVLADGLSLAAEMEPDLIVDLATLTGACMVALGGDVAGLMGNDDDAIGEVRAAADAVGEEVWPLPLPPAYRKQLDSEVADLKNIGGGRLGGALTAGLFLSEFVGDVAWAHLDIAGPAFVDSADGDRTKGGTGFGVRTVLRLVGA